MADGDIEICHQGERWHVRRQGATASLSDHSTKQGAEQEGRRRATAEGVEFFILNLDGTIAGKDSHGNGRDRTCRVARVRAQWPCSKVVLPGTTVQHRNPRSGVQCGM
ncbi:DUF2188 domain-containing protein [Promicromonospora sp. NPDC052451]|uniref:DUF2188 domain-containing protein n=1 Tax=Promicromonospora sp. NPDC052451 TaxID=3364407 RepID=UPI0037C77B5B